jgi:predicted acetyltransferase
MTPSARKLQLDRVDPSQASVLANLLELYCHELSVYFPIRIGVDGRFGYPPLPSYFSEPSRFAYFIRVAGELAGFALATQGSPATVDPGDWDVAEFFVLRSFRGRGIGERAAAVVWNQTRGHWVVRVASRNTPALAFWRRAIQSYTGHDAQERKVVLTGTERYVFEFDSV